jgi:hypothetical protein
MCQADVTIAQAHPYHITLGARTNSKFKFFKKFLHPIGILRLSQ